MANMANRVNRNNNQNILSGKPKYVTVTFKYYENPNTPPQPVANEIVYRISDVIHSFNSNMQSHPNYPKIDIVGLYVDPEEMSVEEQNDLYEGITNDVDKK